MIKHLLMTLSLCSTLTTYAATDWVVISESGDGALFHMNFDRYKYVNSETIEAWVKMTHKPKSESQREAGDEVYALHEYRFNCLNKTVSLISYYSYGKKGKVLFSRNYPYPKVKPVVPESSGEAMHEAACDVHALIRAAREKAL